MISARQPVHLLREITCLIMGLKTASVIFPTCAEYYDSNRADQLLLERRRNRPQTSRRCRLLADTERAEDATSHVFGTAAHAQVQHP